MKEQFLRFFDRNTDAVPTNRGFYYQYLETLKAWVKNFIDGTDIITFTEVDNDIMEVGEELRYRQIKCYSTAFSLSSKEIQNAVFDFFILYFKSGSTGPAQKFCFSTNTSIAKKEKLLSAWIDDPALRDEKLKSQVQKKIRQLIWEEFNHRKNKKLSAITDVATKAEIKEIGSSLKKYIDSDSLPAFVENLEWEFKYQKPVTAVENIQAEVLDLFEHPKFLGKPASLLMGVLLSEVYRCSQNSAKEQRGLSNLRISEILAKTDTEIEGMVNKRFTALLGIELELLKKEIQILHGLHRENATEIDVIKKTIKKSGAAVRELTLIPESRQHLFVGRGELIQLIKEQLNLSDALALFGIGGIGKTAIAKQFVSQATAKDHLIWITVENSIVDAFSLNEVLIHNLNLEFSNEAPLVRFNLIINKINAIDGDNLIVIDLQSSTEQIHLLGPLKWQKLFLTRQPLKTIQSLNVSTLSFEDAKSIYKLYRQGGPEEDGALEAFFEYIHYNILIIELTGKTIAASYDLTLEVFMEKLTSQNLNDPQLEIDIHANHDQATIRIFNFLQETFDARGLDSGERGYLEFLSLLPSTNIVVKELIEICGQELFDENKVNITNYLNGLEKKGWIELSSDRKTVTVHRIIQEMIIYKQRSGNSPFISNMFYIIWLRARLVEGTNHPSRSYNFLKYAESILSAIKEKYRSALYQPLILLENELLYAYGFYYSPKDQLKRWIDLYGRVSLFLAPDDLNLSVISNNLAISYRDGGDYDNAVLYFKKTIMILRKNLPSSAQILITNMNNLSQLYVELGDLPSALTIFAEVQKIRKKNNLWDDQQLSIEYNILSRSYYVCKDLPQAIFYIIEGIALHKSFAKEKRNDFYLANYYDTLSIYHLENNDFGKAVVTLKIAINILVSAGLGGSVHIKGMYSKLLRMYEFAGNDKKVQYLNQKLAAFD